jgi:hypothetical protein
MEEDKRRPGATKMKAIRTPHVTQAEPLEEDSSPHTPQQEVVAGGSTSLVVEPQDNPSVTKTFDWTQQLHYQWIRRHHYTKPREDDNKAHKKEITQTDYR